MTDEEIRIKALDTALRLVGDASGSAKHIYSFLPFADKIYEYIKWGTLPGTGSSGPTGFVTPSKGVIIP